jgi:hypothetical protein
MDDVDTALKSFIAADNELIGKGMAKICLDFAKIAGHGVTLGGITAPVGIGLVVGAAGGKLAISAIGKAESVYAAHQANKGKKKDDPRLEIQNDPQLATALVIEQALAGGPDSAAFKIVKSFGKGNAQLLETIMKAPESDEGVVAIRDIRRKMLSKLDSKDKPPQTLYRQGKEGVDTVKALLSTEARMQEERNYREAKNKLNVGGKSNRGHNVGSKRWGDLLAFKQDLMDVEKSKAVLLEAFDQRVKAQPEGLDAAWVDEVRGLLKPRVEDV